MTLAAMGIQERLDILEPAHLGRLRGINGAQVDLGRLLLAGGHSSEKPNENGT